MRAMCIGLRFPREKHRDKLIAISIESARITHNHPNAFFGAYVSALFTAYAVEVKRIKPSICCSAELNKGVNVVEWGRKMLNELPNAVEYVKSTKRDWDNYQKQSNFTYFEEQWKKYLKLRYTHSLFFVPLFYKCQRNILDPSSKAAVFPDKWGPVERDQFYKSVSFDGWGGSSGMYSLLFFVNFMKLKVFNNKDMIR